MAGRPKSRGYVREWMTLAGLKQVDLIKKLDYSKSKANAVWHGEQRLNEDLLEEIAALVNAASFELLLTPERAHRLRNLEAALRVVASTPDPAPASETDAPSIPHKRAL